MITIEKFYLTFLIKEGEPEQDIEITKKQYEKIMETTSRGHIRCQVRSVDKPADKDSLVKQYGYSRMHHTYSVHGCACKGCEVWRRCLNNNSERSSHDESGGAPHTTKSRVRRFPESF